RLVTTSRIDSAGWSSQIESRAKAQSRKDKRKGQFFGRIDRILRIDSILPILSILSKVFRVFLCGFAPLREIDADEATCHRCAVTPTCRHMSSTGQVEHFG